MTVGPFGVTAAQIEQLDLRFTPFINRLLEVERMAQQISGHLLSITSRETTPDGGVDAELFAAVQSDFLPAGQVAVQFKRSNFAPKACADELAKASSAKRVLQSGGTYIIAIAADLPKSKIDDREKKLFAMARELKLVPEGESHRIRVYDASKLARWASRFPALAISDVAGGPGTDALDLEGWSQRRTHQQLWVSDELRDQAMAALRSQVESDGLVDMRVQGESGVGKTRLVLEALRKSELSSLVAYLPDEGSLDGGLLRYLGADARAAILVVDECPPERHVKVVERLSTDPSVKLITIGPSGTVSTRSPVIQLLPVKEPTTDEFLVRNYPQFPPETRRFVVDHSKGNMRWTIVLADRVGDAKDGQAAELIARNDIEQFVAMVLPEGRDFFCVAALALLERVGWEGEVRHELETLAAFADTSVEDMEGAASQLEQQGLLVRQGRYRSVAPQPLAVFLAAEAWKIYGVKVLEELSPRLDEQAVSALFNRAADLGRFEPVRKVFERLLVEGGPLGTLKSIETSESRALITPVAVVIPKEMSLHLHGILSTASLCELRERGVARRDLVWALQALAWHSRTFETASDSLLRLALAENESYANNATGAWVGLFATLLPATAAGPAQRKEYLFRIAKTDDPAILKIVTQAAAGALQHSETVMVSGELQRGVLVEPRGTPATLHDATEYRVAMIRLLSELCTSTIDGVSQAAETALINAIHQTIDAPGVMDPLTEAVAHLSSEAQLRLRAELEHLVSLYNQASEADARTRAQLQQLLGALPAPSRLDDLRTIARLNRWDLGEGQLRERIRTALVKFEDRSELVEALRRVLGDPTQPAAWELGYESADLDDSEHAILNALVDMVGANPAALHGYLAARTQLDDADAYAPFLDGSLGQRLTAAQRVAVAVRGEPTPATHDRVIGGVKALPLTEGVPNLFGWQDHLTPADIESLILTWEPTVQTQQDYNTLIDWIGFLLHSSKSIPDAASAQVWKLLGRRREFQELGNERRHWARVAETFVTTRTSDLVTLLLDLVDGVSFSLLRESDESSLLSACAKAAPAQAWSLISERLESGNWRLQMFLRGWFPQDVPITITSEWVGSDLARARLLASIAPISDDGPSEQAQFLLEHFGKDRRVASALYGTLTTGIWWGSEANRIEGQIQKLAAWRLREDLPGSAKDWARDAISGLRAEQSRAAQREAEDSL